MSEKIGEVELRLNALNLAVGLHKDTFRFTFEKNAEDPKAQAITEQTLLTAGRFLDWLHA